MTFANHPVNGTVDRRFSAEEAAAPAWADVEALLAGAELYWLTTVRSNGRPHVTPAVGLWHDGAFCFCTGEGEQKQRNLVANEAMVVTTGANAWADGTDVVVEGTATRVTGVEALAPVATAYIEKYGDAWRFEAEEDGLRAPEGHLALAYRVAPTKVLVFAKNPHGQTVFRP